MIDEAVMKAIGELAAEVLADVGSKRFGLKDRGTEAPRQVVLASKQNSLPGKAARFQETGDIAGDGEGFGPSIERVDRSR